MIELSGAIGGGAFDRERLITANSEMITGKPLIGAPKRSHKICAHSLENTVSCPPCRSM